MMFQFYAIWLRLCADAIDAMTQQPPAPVKAKPVRKPCHLRIVK